MSSSPQPLGLGFATTTPSDHRAWLWVAGFLALIYSLLALGARLVAKWGLLWYDDIVLTAAYACAITHWGLLFTAIANGLAVSDLLLASETVRQTAQVYFGARITLLAAHYLAKLSILVFTRRIFAGDIYKENLYFRLSYTVTIALGIVSILLCSAGCTPSESLVASPNAVCSNNTARWAVITALDGLTELIILAMPAWFISRNQLKASKKRIVVFVYMFRLIVIVFTIVQTTTYLHFLRHGRSNLDIGPVVAWQEVLLAFSLVSASFPCLRSFIWAFMSRGLMTMYGNTTGSNSASRNPSVQLRSMSKSLHRSRQDSEAGESRYRLRPEQTAYHVDVSRGQTNNQDRGRGFTGASDDSNQMIIHQETTYRVDSIRV